MSGIVYGCITPHPPIMLPPIGRGREARVSASIEAMGKVSSDLAEACPDSVFIVSPHGTIYPEAMGVVTSRAVKGDMERWGAPGVDYRFENDLDLVEALQEEADAANIPLKPIDGPEYGLDHGVMVPAYFLIGQLRARPLVPLSFSILSLEDHLAFGRVVARAAQRSSKRVALIASGDLSHRLIPEAPAGFDPIGHQFDEQVNKSVASLDIQALVNLDPVTISRAGECGLRSIMILLGAIEEVQVAPRVLSYEGPFGVGYLTATFPLRQPVAHPLVSLARQAVEGYVRKGSVLPAPLGLKEQATRKAGIFVSIFKDGELRGCVGTVEPTRGNLEEEVISSAIGAATRDQRFPPVYPQELSGLEYSVYVLSPLEPVTGLDQLAPRVYGLVVRGTDRTGLLLPGLEAVQTPEKQLQICLQKAGLEPQGPVEMFRFTVERYQDPGLR